MENTQLVIVAVILFLLIPFVLGLIRRRLRKANNPLQAVRRAALAAMDADEDCVVIISNSEAQGVGVLRRTEHRIKSWVVDPKNSAKVYYSASEALKKAEELALSSGKAILAYKIISKSSYNPEI